MKALVITIFGIVLSLVATFVNSPPVVLLAAVIAFYGAYAQYRDSLPFEQSLEETSWQILGEKSFKLIVPKSLHGKSNPIVTFFEGDAPNFQKVMASFETNSNEDVTTVVTSPFKGKVVIK